MPWLLTVAAGAILAWIGANGAVLRACVRTLAASTGVPMGYDRRLLGDLPNVTPNRPDRR